MNEHRRTTRMGRTTSKGDGRKDEEARHTQQRFLRPQDGYDHWETTASGNWVSGSGPELS